MGLSGASPPGAPFRANSMPPPQEPVLRASRCRLMTKAFPATRAGRILAVSLLSVLALGAMWAVATRAANPLSWTEWPKAAHLHSNMANFADIVDAVRPTVFAIESRVVADDAADDRDGDDPDADVAPPSKSPHFAQPDDTPGTPPPPSRRLMVSRGSGFFISPDGYAVTNGHVVENADSTQILTDDQKTYAAKVIGIDPVSDLALLKVDGRDDFPFATFAEDLPRVGNWILAFGNPFGLGGTVTAGIVSARERNIGTGSYQDLIQIDASINKGDSGGPSFDLDGKVVGVNTMIISPSGGSIGIAFAIPAETVKTVMPQLKEKGTVTRGWLGVQMQPVTPDVAETLEMKDVRGALVVRLDATSPAAKAGIAAGDVITSVDDEPVRQVRDLARKVSNSAPGTVLRLGVLHRGERKTTRVTLSQMPTPRNAPANASPAR
jgi:serine protease Do